MLPSITELQNELTVEIDVASTEQMLRLFRQTDSQIFNGWREHEGILDPSVLASVEALSRAAFVCMENSASSLIVLSGAGTSGRLAYLCCHQFNRILEALHMRPCFRYLIAGGDPALVRPVEGAEDDPQRALQVCRVRYSSSHSHDLLIGPHRLYPRLRHCAQEPSALHWHHVRLLSAIHCRPARLHDTALWRRGQLKPHRGVISA